MVTTEGLYRMGSVPVRPLRVTAVNGTTIELEGEAQLHGIPPGTFAVGDWVTVTDEGSGELTETADGYEYKQRMVVAGVPVTTIKVTL